MLKIIFSSFIFLFCFSLSAETISPYGGIIKNRKNGDMIVAKCHWLMDDKTQGKIICADLRLHLTDKNYNDIRELSKIQSPDMDRSDLTFGTDEYIRNSVDYVKIFIKKMQRNDTFGQALTTQIQNIDYYFQNQQTRDYNFHNYALNYLKNLPAVLFFYPFGLALRGIEYIHTELFYSRKIAKESLLLYKSLNELTTKNSSYKKSFKNKFFKFSVDSIEN